jgi:hypothetical protein
VRWTAALLLATGAVSAAGCGGGSGAGGGSAASYAFVPPPVNSQRKYDETIVDNQNNTIELSYTETVLSASPDGSYVVQQEDPNHESVTVNGTIYSIETETVTLNDAGQELSYTAEDAGGTLAVVCNFAPHGAGPDSPVTVGMSWTLDYTLGCGGQTPTPYVQSGTAVDVESITVPAGTYSALKLQSTISWTDAQGTHRTQTVTNWRDIATSVSVKQSITISYSGTLPSTGYAVSRDITLESM